jgi:hypothetical protein
VATTSIWAVKGWLGQAVIYVENPEKTENPKFIEQQNMNAEQTQGLSDVIGYAMNDGKTELVNEQAEIKKHFVSGVNCNVATARDEMMATKKHFSKTNGIVCYHGYQSFAPNEATPEMAHEIGVKLAETLWGDNFQVIVATHLDKSHLIHNHFVVNNVSMYNGKKYRRTNQDYRDMQRESDALCREYGLSVVETAEHSKSKHYAEWKAEHHGKPTYRSMIKEDLDSAIRQSMTERQLWENLKKRGYSIKFGQDITLRPAGRERGIKLKRNFGDDYSIENIRRRILEQTRPERTFIPSTVPKKAYRFNGNLYRSKRMTGLRALYFYYLYRMGVLPRKREPNPKRVYFQFREDIRFIQRISQEARLLAKHGIDTDTQLTAHKDTLTAQIFELSDQRRILRNNIRSEKDEDRKTAIRDEIAELSSTLGKLRQEVRLCDEIEKRSAAIKSKLNQVREDEKLKGKERKAYEHFR